MKADIQDNERNLAILQQEAELLGEITAIQESIRAAVINREWTDFEALLGSLKTYSDQFDALEAERTALFACFHAEPRDGTEAGFYALVSRLPEPDRSGLTGAYRNIKLRALRVRMANDSLMTYLNEARATVDIFLKAAFPDRKTGVYSRQGTQISADMRSMVLNQSF
ncbi:MAG: hypothetical protein LBT14_09325 [Treponema sp.]|jgi:hypothetical protein|nr:hypothetical protein [Treponema sp.]